MKKNGTYILIVLSIIIIGISIYILTKNEVKIACVDSKKIFDGFILKKELEKKLEKDHASRLKLIDSTGMIITGMIKEYEDTRNAQLGAIIDNRKEAYLKMKEAFEKDQMIQTESYDNQITTQMKQYIKDYGVANDYDYILTKQDEMGVVYCKEQKDITKEVLEFINQKFKGIK